MRCSAILLVCCAACTADVTTPPAPASNAPQSPSKASTSPDPTVDDPSADDPMTPGPHGKTGSTGVTGKTMPGTPEGPLNLRADSDRDGALSGADDAQDDVWDASAGAVFLANLDDDQQKCPTTGTDSTLYKCFDAADGVVNGSDDLLDFAPLALVPWPNVGAGTTAQLSVDAASEKKVQLFRKTGAQYALVSFDDTLSTDDLKNGVDFILEGTDVVRDGAVWSGFVDLTVTASSGESDTVRLRVAPVITYHHLLPAQEAFASDVGGSESQTFLSDLGAAATSAAVPRGLTPVEEDDQWTQDFFETGYMSMPAAGGTQHTLLTAYRSVNQTRGGGDILRPAGKWVYTTFRGKDRVGLQQYGPKQSVPMDSLNSFGNFETVPPYSFGGVDYPLGRVIRGAVPSRHPDPVFTKMVDSQLMQPAIEIDTSWLSVGHVDETLSFVKASTPRGWILLANDARLAKQMLQDASNAGHGSVKLFAGMVWGTGGFGDSAEVTIDQVLADQDVMGESASSAAAVDAQIAKVKQETGLTDAEIVRVPYLHQPANAGNSGSVAYQPGTVNGIYLADGTFAAPNPHGPVIGGKDIMKDQLEKALQPFAITVQWIEDWDLYHAQMGEVHCGSNVLRAIPSVKWWESGR
jgi:protein-arginine deiminase